MTDSPTPWTKPAWITRTQEILNSYEKWLGHPLIPRSGDPAEESHRLYHAPFVIVSHGTEADPVLNYGNATALALWEMPLPDFTRTPSRLTAEPMHRDERARMLEQTARTGYIDDYRGIRIASTGRRFRIDPATVWNVINAEGHPAGQAATFATWTFLDDQQSDA
ncbi:MEKHLA domain-containing protein [Planctomyces sp. SH-PL14]|uniref:MEKHLA domain-containing protein n=1 Tax=Planctomyces sp. SH-PL14 TaxID=1632864 RepID=UPI00078ECD09|nr:MEKHLA domain-containing protein [Planctomyces sp. SH-PL14]AMV18053.1 MEKHLA domain protein [Planctomyces sp. SH-PL14]